MIKERIVMHLLCFTANCIVAIEQAITANSLLRFKFEPLIDLAMVMAGETTVAILPMRVLEQ